MADQQIKNEISEKIDSLIDSFVEEINEMVEEKKEYAKLHRTLNVIENESLKKVLEGILDQVQKLKENKYTPRAHYQLIKKYNKAGQVLRTKLFPDTTKRFKDLVIKESKYLMMQTSDYDQKCAETIGCMGNLVPIEREPIKQVFYLNALLNLIIDFRLRTLSDEQAWDFVAQSVLKTTP